MMISSKFHRFTPSYMYNKPTYPKYLSGSGYVFTMDTAEKLYNSSLEIPLLHLEDVYLTGKRISFQLYFYSMSIWWLTAYLIYITGLCAEREGIEPQNHHLFHYLRYNRLCESRGMLSLHGLKLNDMEKTYAFVMNSNIICAAPSGNATPRHVKKTKVCNWFYVLNLLVVYCMFIVLHHYSYCLYMYILFEFILRYLCKTN